MDEDEKAWQQRGDDERIRTIMAKTLLTWKLVSLALALTLH